jgi:hypothetical protein
MSILSDKNFDRFLYRRSTTTSAYEQFGDDKLSNAVLEAASRPATAVAPGTVIQSTIFQSSGSNDRVEITPNDQLVVYRDGVPVVIIDQDGMSTTRTIVNKGFAQPVIIGAGFVNANGTVSPTVFPVGWTCTLLSTGRYEITHNLNSGDYCVLATPVAGTTREFSIEAQTINTFITRFYDNTSASLIDTDHSFLVYTNP